MAVSPTQMRAAGIAPARRRGLVGRVGAYLIDVWRRVALSVAVGLTALWRMMWLHTWRPTVRQEFVRHCWQVGIKALPTTILTAAIIGVALAVQVFIIREGGFRDVAGVLNLNTLFLLALVREIAPLLVALIIIGRSATVMITELVNLRIGGQIHMLDSLGIDAFDYLVVARIAAIMVCASALGVIFVFSALVSGQLIALALGFFSFGLLEFLIRAASLLTPADYLILPLKTFGLGLLIGVVACVTALRETEVGADVRELVPLGYMRAVVSALILSGAITALVVM